MIDGDDGSSDAAELLELTGCEFNCLQNHLKNVKLQFVLKELNSFVVSLAKFFVENCMALELLQIDDGNQNFGSHINRIVERWRVNVLEQRKQMEQYLTKVLKHTGKGNIILVGNRKR